MSQVASYLKATLGIVLTFCIFLFMGGNSLALSLLVAVLFGATAFLLHEWMHYVVARRLGYDAYFVSYDQMLLVSVAAAFFRIIFLAPGGVVIHGIKSRRDHGKIAIAGPLTNVVLGLGFLFIGLHIHQFFIAGFIINALLAFFNMLPVMGLDGQAIWHWNKIVYAITSLGVVILYGFAMFGNFY